MPKKDLYTESRVRELPAGSELVLGPAALATPAALDLCFARGIRVRWAKEGGAPAPSAPTDAMWRRILATDSTYVVEVRGGRPRVTRLTAGGPAPVKPEKDG